jgi:hypothetical protein
MRYALHSLPNLVPSSAQQKPRRIGRVCFDLWSGLNAQRLPGLLSLLPQSILQQGPTMFPDVPPGNLCRFLALLDQVLDAIPSVADDRS